MTQLIAINAQYVFFKSNPKYKHYEKLAFGLFVPFYTLVRLMVLPAGLIYVPAPLFLFLFLSLSLVVEMKEMGGKIAATNDILKPQVDTLVIVLVGFGFVPISYDWLSKEKADFNQRHQGKAE